MDIIFGFGHLVMGTLITLIGFRVYYPFKWKEDQERIDAWHKKWGTFFKVAGILIILVGILKIFDI